MRIQDMTIEELAATVKDIKGVVNKTQKQKSYLGMLEKELHKRRYETDREYKIYIDAAQRLAWRSYNKKYGRKFFFS